jgi:hypothetical protein
LYGHEIPAVAHIARFFTMKKKKALSNEAKCLFLLVGRQGFEPWTN